MNLVATIMATEGWITLPGYFYLGGVSVVGSIFVFIIVSYLTSKRKDEHLLAELYEGPAVEQHVRPTAQVVN